MHSSMDIFKFSKPWRQSSEMHSSVDNLNAAFSINFFNSRLCILLLNVMLVEEAGPSSRFSCQVDVLCFDFICLVKPDCVLYVLLHEAQAN